MDVKPLLSSEGTRSFVLNHRNSYSNSIESDYPLNHKPGSILKRFIQNILPPEPRVEQA
jgi:hypothetical protein